MIAERHVVILRGITMKAAHRVMGFFHARFLTRSELRLMNTMWACSRQFEDKKLSQKFTSRKIRSRSEVILREVTERDFYFTERSFLLGAYL